MNAPSQYPDKISVIIPVCNVEPYIRKCLDSVAGQTYANLEILLINDGSTDNSGKICDEYAGRDGRFRVFHQNNRGVGVARNIGLENMTGKYTGFVDPDDWIEPDMYETLYGALKSENVPISISGYFKDTCSESLPAANRERIPAGAIPTRDMLLYPLKRDYYMGFCGYMWNKLFDAAIFLNNGLRFDVNLNYGEDVLLYTQAVLTGKCTGAYVDRPLYHYYQRDGSIARSKSIDLKTGILTVYKKVEELLNENGYPDISRWARGFYCHHASVIAEIAIETLRQMQGKIEEHLEDYKETNREFPKKFERMHGLLNG